MKDEIIVRLTNMPDHTGGMVVEDPDGIYNIYIDKDITREQQQKVYLHELEHIKAGHLRDLDKSVLICEEEADYGIKSQEAALRELEGDSKPRDR